MSRRPKAVGFDPYRCTVVREDKKEPGLWYWRARLKDKTVATFWARRHEVSEIMAAKISGKELNLPAARPAPAAVDTVRDLIQFWGGHIQQRLTMVGRRKLSPKSARGYMYRARRIVKYLGTHRIDRLRVADTQQMVDNMAGDGLSDSTIVATVRAFRAAWNWGRSQGLTPLGDTPVVMPWDPELLREKYIPPHRDVQVVLDHAKDERVKWRHQVLLMLFTSGARRFEIAWLGGPTGASWDRIDLERGTMLILGKGGRGKRGQDRERLVYLHPLVHELLEERWAQGLPLFDVRASTIEDLNKYLRRTCQLLGVRYFHPHAVRRMFITAAIRNGLNLKAIGRTTGQLPKTIIKDYQGVNEMEKRSVVLAGSTAPKGVKLPFRHRLSGTGGLDEV